MTDFAKRGHYQLACARYFELKHGAEKDSISINHPNEFFDLSRKPVTKSEGKKTTLFFMLKSCDSLFESLFLISHHSNST